MGKYIDDHVRLQGRRFNAWVRRVQIVTFPLIFIALFVVAPGWSAAARFDAPMGLPAIVATWLGIVLGVAGGALYLWTITLFARAWGTQVPVAPTQRLVTAGPYSVTRNPMVTGAILMVCGLGVFRDSWSFVIGGLVIPSFYLVYLKLVEERELEARFGAEYVVYKEATPFLLPRPRRPVKA